MTRMSGGAIASRMPVLNLLPSGQYYLQLTLPVGADLRYTYTLGDGYWNTELNKDGSRRVRQLIVPESDQLIQDTVDTWIAGNSAPITFDVNVPANTPAPAACHRRKKCARSQGYPRA